MQKAIYFDMDGTIANLYGVENWLPKLLAEDATPYATAKVLVNMAHLARVLNRLQKQGYHIGIISWLCKGSTANYDAKVTQAKTAWLKKHLPSVQFNEINIIPYGLPKQKNVQYAKGILFDDEEQNRNAWLGKAYDEKEIIETLKKLLKNL